MKLPLLRNQQSETSLFQTLPFQIKSSRLSNHSNFHKCCPLTSSSRQMMSQWIWLSREFVGDSWPASGSQYTIYNALISYNRMLRFCRRHDLLLGDNVQSSMHTSAIKNVMTCVWETKVLYIIMCTIWYELQQNLKSRYHCYNLSHLYTKTQR